MKKKFNPWPYGLAAVLIAFCIIQFSLVAVASSGFEGLDDVEYYRHGIEYGEEIDRQERQRDLGWTVAHNLESLQGPSEAFPLRIALLDSDKKPIMHAKMNVKIGRPATMRDDRKYEFKEVGPGVYAADVSLAQGNWIVDIEVEKSDNLVKVQYRHSVEQGPSTEDERNLSKL